MLLLGIDLGTSSVKVTVVNSQTQTVIASVQYPDTEVPIISLQAGWAEQVPEEWWNMVQQAILLCHSTKKYNPKDISSIGIAYQMHGLVLVNKDQKVLHNAIIWCDSRAVTIGEYAYDSLGHQQTLEHLLNSPGNFTASKLAWIKKNKKEVFDQIDKILLPGDFIAMKLTGTISTTVAALSEGIFWDFKLNCLSKAILDYFDFPESIFPEIKSLFGSHGTIKSSVADSLNLNNHVTITYKAGDQPNNAFSLNVLNPGDVAANAGTSGVIYGVSNQLKYDLESRINSFAHVNHSNQDPRIGVLLCINGTGIFNKWVKQIVGDDFNYESINRAASNIELGANGLLAMPFGNGAERMLGNKTIGAHFSTIDFNIHTTAHLFRATQESIAFAMRYGLDIMRNNGINPSLVKANKTNLFLSELFTQAFASVNNVSVEFYEGDGSYGAAIGAGIGAGIYFNSDEAFSLRKPIEIIHPKHVDQYQAIYENWKIVLNQQLNNFK
jgi:xylulokinase